MYLSHGKIVCEYYNQFTEMFAEDERVNLENVVASFMTLPDVPQGYTEELDIQQSSSPTISAEDSRTLKSNCREKIEKITCLPKATVRD
ncbi:hypothetical protein NQ314_017313 [Rhamnusium bicolor]|uniref:Retrotransposon gag domain-containing protein n=1 Tax=Rhamnusium bicolor TaxID=1586634 RepID=A0AAV8WTJ4_9CUCU|nr:hypothetical protein NQ314_017313 [Rhamnusium bicolor]